MTGVVNRAAAETASPGDVLLRLDLPAITRTQLVFYCGAAAVHDPIHFDRDFARRFGFADCVVNGSLRVAWMAEAASSILRAPDHLRELGCSHVKPMLVGDVGVIELRVRERQASPDGDLRLVCDLEIRVGDTVTDRADAVLCFV